MNIASYAKTDVGRAREHNEDFALADPALGLFVVSDGMGGQEAGEVASQITATTVRRVVAEMRDVMVAVASGRAPSDRLSAVLRTAIETACAEVHAEGAKDAAKKGMGATCTALLLCGGKAALGHVGDSRLYLCRGGGKVTQLSEDHTFLAEAVKQGVFSPEEAATSPYKNVITRAIGKERTVIVGTLLFDVVLGDTLLLCSDGLHQYTRDAAELGAILAAPAAESVADRLIRLANERGGSDNITAIVLRATLADANSADARRTSDVLANLGALQQIELMKDLSMAEVVKLNQVFQEQRFPAGTLVIREGEVSDLMFVLAQGSAEVMRGGQRIALLQGGAHFGEMALLNSRPRSATVRALEPCRMLIVDRNRLYGFLQQDGMLAAKFFWKLAETLSRRLDEVLLLQEEMHAAATTSAAR